MARLLYRLLRVVNIVGSFEESALRRAMTNSSVMSQLQRLVAAELSKPLSYVLPLTGRAMAPALNAAVNSQKEEHDRVSPYAITRAHKSCYQLTDARYVAAGDSSHEWQVPDIPEQSKWGSPQHGGRASRDPVN